MSRDQLPPAIEGTLQGLFDSCPSMPLSKSGRIIVISDLHLGDGSTRDDFLPNGELLEEALRSYYLPRGATLVLNGDIEELQRFPMDSIRARWKGLYGVFKRFADRSLFHRIVGNHDEALWRGSLLPSQRLEAGLRLVFGGETLFLFHGHQATIFFERFNEVSGFFLRHFANRLHIRNVPAHYESTKRYRTEHRVYGFSSARKIVSIIGHTHRPLFESLSKIDTLRFRIEQLCRDYPTVSPRARRAIAQTVASSRAELHHLWEKDRRTGMRGGLYSGLTGEQLPVPCLFNSGCAIGKRGLTAIEIEDGRIALVQWFDRRREDRYPARGRRRAVAAPPMLSADDEAPTRLGETDFYRRVVKQDRLDYIFSRIRLLA